MRVLFYHSAPGWTGSARAFAAAAAGLAERGYQVTYSCPPDSETEERLAQMGRFETIPVEAGGSWPAEARRLRQVLLSRFVEVVFVHTEREHLVAAAATRWAERGATPFDRIERDGPGAVERGVGGSHDLRVSAPSFGQ